mgnify:CR=1 FL=1
MLNPIFPRYDFPISGSYPDSGRPDGIIPPTMLQHIGRYEILERIAIGGQGTAYRARDTVLNRVVAVKVINQSVVDDPNYLEALQRKARLAAGLDHPNATRVHDFQVEQNTPYIIMEYVPDALDRHLQNGRRKRTKVDRPLPLGPIRAE